MSKTIANVTAATSVTTGFWSWVNANAGALSVSIAFCAAIISLAFYILNYIENRRKNKEEHEVKTLEKLRIARALGVSPDEVIDNPELLKTMIERERRRFNGG